MLIVNIRKITRHGVPSVQRFARDESGSLIMFSLFLFVLMTIMGGIAVDVMKYETTRTTIQQTLDRSTLAAASLTQEMDPESVVTDYFDKAGMSEWLTSVTVTEGMNFRNVNAKATAATDPFFMHMIGIDSFDALGASTAEQRIANVEISLVLDVSGSMAGAKLTNLKTAAKEFVDTVLSSDSDKRISISIVPYNAQVNLGATLRAKYNATHQHGVANANCLELTPAMHTVNGISRTVAIPMMAYADIAYATNKVNSPVSPTDTNYAKANFGTAWCPVSTVNVVRLPNQSISVLQSQIQNLVAAGNTSIMTGMKWGLALIDPSARPMFEEFISVGAIPATLTGRPFEYDDDEAIKVVVLMTDGEHVAHEFVKDAFKTGPSSIYLSSGDGNYSVYHSARSGNKYWTPHRSEWRAAAWNSGAGVTQLDWKVVWTKLKATYVAWQFYARATGTSDSTRNTIYTNKLNEIRGTFASVTAMNEQLQQSCTLAKNNAVIVYGIAFEAPTNGQMQISNCATSPGHYFNASGLEIQTAFRAIASNISQLRLTQ